MFRMVHKHRSLLRKTFPDSNQTSSLLQFPQELTILLLKLVVVPPHDSLDALEVDVHLHVIGGRTFEAIGILLGFNLGGKPHGFLVFRKDHPVGLLATVTWTGSVLGSSSFLKGASLSGEALLVLVIVEGQSVVLIGQSMKAIL